MSGRNADTGTDEPQPPIAPTTAGSSSPAGTAFSRDWFARDPLEVARDLLGTHLRVERFDGAVTLRITEVESYHGVVDPGSHAFRGLSARNEVMYGEAGRLYTYRHMGLHTCVNVVCGEAGSAAAVLLRAGEVIDGADLARGRRRASGTVRSDVDLARGPARLTVALGITMADLGADLLDPDGDFALTTGSTLAPGAVATGPRVGVSGSGGDGQLFPWRLWIDGDESVSDYRRASTRRRPAGQNEFGERPRGRS